MAVMVLPFTSEQFLNIFAQYNLAVFPLQIVFIILGIVALGLVIKKSQLSDRIIALILSFFWFWMGLVYHILFFSTINPLAYVFGMLFIVEAVLLFYIGVIKKPGWVQPSKGQVHSYRSGFYCICSAYLPNNRDVCWARVSTVANIWPAMPNDYINVWYFFNG
jgi:hypothetical protein